jgi:hypothetical protein
LSKIEPKTKAKKTSTLKLSRRKHAKRALTPGVYSVKCLMETYEVVDYGSMIAVVTKYKTGTDGEAIVNGLLAIEAAITEAAHKERCNSVFDLMLEIDPFEGEIHASGRAALVQLA